MKSHYKKASARIARRSKIRKATAKIFQIGFPLVFLVGFFWFARIDFLQIKNFEVAGVKTIPAEELKNLASSFASGNKLFFIPKSNYFVLSKNNLASAITSRFSSAEKIEISKNILNQTAVLKITEREIDSLWCNDNKCFPMTEEGLVFDWPDGIEKRGEEIIFKGLIEGDPIMQNFATPEKMKNYENLISTFKDNKILISEINIESSDKAVAKSNIGNIIFNPEEKDLATVAQNVLLLINEIKSKSPPASFLYLDARFGNKIFYKLK